MFPNSAYAVPTGSFNVPIAPPTTDPDTSPYTDIRVSCEWLPFIRACLQQLLLQTSWDTDAAGLEQVQYRAARLIRMFGDEACDVCDCLRFIGSQAQKSVSDGHGGSVWVNVDPRTENADMQPPPWPTPPSGQTGNCLSAANCETMFANMMGHASNVLATEAEIGALLVAFMDFLDLTLGPIGEVVTIAANWGVAALAAGATVFAAAWDTTTQATAFDGIRCLMQCYMNPNGSITAAGIEFVKNDFFAKIDGWVTNPSENALWRIFFPDFLDSQGPNGLGKAGNLFGVVAFDCSGCDCGWCRTYDFLATDGGATPYTSGGAYGGEWVSGRGWKNHAGNPRMDLQLLLGSVITFTVAEMEYEEVDGPGGGAAITMYSLPVTTVVTAGVSTGIHNVRSATGVFVGDNVLVEFGMGAGFTGYLRRITLHGDGSNPLGGDNCF